MTTYEFSQELKRLAAICPDFVSKEEAKEKTPLGAELWRKFGHLDSGAWNKVITWVLEHHKTRFAPILAEFISAYDATKTASYVTESSISRTSGEAHYQWMLAEANSLGPKGAKFVLDLIAKNAVIYPQEIMEILLAKAAEEDSVSALSSATTAGVATTAPAIVEDEAPPE